MKYLFSYVAVSGDENEDGLQIFEDDGQGPDLSDEEQLFNGEV